MVAHLSKAVGEGGTVIAIDAEAAMVEYLAKRSDDLGQPRSCHGRLARTTLSYRPPAWTGC